MKSQLSGTPRKELRKARRNAGICVVRVRLANGDDSETRGLRYPILYDIAMLHVSIAIDFYRYIMLGTHSQ